MLLTNDGELANRLAHPKFGVEKLYRAIVAGTPSREVLDKLTEGVWLAEGKVRAKRVRAVGRKGEATILELVLAEGKNREVRRMLAKFGHKVMSLTRVAVGPITLKGLGVGEYRPLSGHEIDLLRKVAAGIIGLPDTVLRAEGEARAGPAEAVGAPRAGEGRPAGPRAQQQGPAPRRPSSPGGPPPHSGAPRRSGPRPGAARPVRRRAAAVADRPGGRPAASPRGPAAVATPPGRRAGCPGAAEAPRATGPAPIRSRLSAGSSASTSSPNPRGRPAPRAAVRGPSASPRARRWGRGGAGRRARARAASRREVTAESSGRD